jgi:hypothetical protein
VLLIPQQVWVKTHGVSTMIDNTWRVNHMSFSQSGRRYGTVLARKPTWALTSQGVCLLLGLAVAVAIEANVGKAGAMFLRDYDKRVVEEARAERAKAEQASAASSARK